MMLQSVRLLEAEAEKIEGAHARDVAMRSIPLEIAVATGWSEHQAQNRIFAARRVRSDAPATWLAFTAGRIDAARVTAISSALDQLTLAASKAALDQSVVAYAETHTVGELRGWLKRFVASIEPELAADRATAEREARSVRVSHVDDAMAWVMAYVPSVAATAIEKRLDHAARMMTDDDRTLDQRRADLFMAWLTNAENSEPSLRADVAVVVPAEVLAGASDAMAESADGSWVTPASWLLDYAGADDIVWHRLLTDPAGEVLDYTYIGRFASDQLTAALNFRDRVCRAPGCTKSARDCDQDHLRPWPDGPTAGRNLGALCRRHHRMKSHGVLTWTLPSGQSVPADRHAHAPPIRPPSAREDGFARIAIEFSE